MKIELTKVDIDNLKVFLARVQLTGQEVPAYTQILQAIYKAEEEKPKKVGD